MKPALISAICMIFVAVPSELLASNGDVPSFSTIMQRAPELGLFGWMLWMFLRHIEKKDLMLDEVRASLNASTEMMGQIKEVLSQIRIGNLRKDR